jgi:hypothetical protein
MESRGTTRQVDRRIRILFSITVISVYLNGAFVAHDVFHRPYAEVLVVLVGALGGPIFGAGFFRLLRLTVSRPQPQDAIEKTVGG